MDVKKLFEEVERQEKTRQLLMPTEKDAIKMLFEAYQRLQELGWRDIIYCPKDGSTFDAISPGSTGICPTQFWEKPERGSFWGFEAGDVWPSHPILWKK